MVFAIIESVSDTSSVTTVACCETCAELAKWYADEVEECFEMYASEESSSEEQEALKQCRELWELAKAGALTLKELSGIVTGSPTVSVELVGVYRDYREFCDGFESYKAQKPELKKITPEENPADIEKECDRLKSLLIRSSIEDVVRPM